MDGSMQTSFEIPSKSTFKINEVCALTGVKSYVLRYWETEFDEIAPIPSSNGHKLYERKDIEAILLIKKLLFDDKLTVEKARAYLKRNMPEHKLLDERFAEVEPSKLANVEAPKMSARISSLDIDLDVLQVTKLLKAKEILERMIQKSYALEASFR